MAWAKKSSSFTTSTTTATNTTKHSHGANFGKHVADCPRCVEIKNNTGEPVVKWKMSNDAIRSQEIRNHNCVTSRCGVVCTFGDY